MQDLGQITNLEVIQKYVDLDGKHVADIGCGSMIFTKQIAELAELVYAIDPDPIQAELNRQSAPHPGIEFQESGGDHLQIDDSSIDGVFFSYSLHHIPAELYPSVFAEIRRTLKPQGFVYVIEPIDCPLNQVMRLFHNEDVERAAAQSALRNDWAPHFKYFEEVTYHGFTQYDSFEHFVDRFGSRSFNELYSREDVASPKVEKAFHEHGKPDYQFASPKQVTILRELIE